MPLFDDSRAAWGAASSTNPRRVAASARVGVSWHYPGGYLKITPATAHSACLSQVRAWQRAHQAKGWADIGYNLLICQHGRVIEGRGADYQGSHSPGVNYSHYGVQFMTSNDEAPTAAMYARAVKLRADLEARSGKTLRQWGHRDDPKASTACPGDTIERWVKAGGPYKSTSTVPTTPSSPSTPTPPKETSNMALDAADIKKIWQSDIVPSPDKEASNPTWQPDSYLRETYRLVRSSAAQARARDEAMTAAIKALADAKGGDGAAIAAAVEQAVRDRLAQVRFDIVEAPPA